MKEISSPLPAGLRRVIFGIGLSLGLMTLSHCSSTGSRVLERADGLGDNPSWASVTKPSYESNGKKYFVGFIEVEGDASKSGALNMSDEKALSEPMRSLVDQYLDQNQVGENLRKEAAIGQRVISATRGFRVPMPALTIVNRYWETVAVDEYTTETRAFSLAEIPIAEYEKAKRDYFQLLAGNSEMKRILTDVGKKQRERILGNGEPPAKE